VNFAGFGYFCIFAKKTMLIDRHITDSIQKKLLKGNKIVVLYGARQLGKTTICKQIIAATGLKTFEVNADQAKYVDVLSSRDVNRIQSMTEGYQLLFIDEAQRIPNLGINLKIIKDELPNLKVLVTGSSSLTIAQSISEPLTGRKVVFHLYPVSLREIGKKMNTFETLEYLNELLIYGAYPEVITTKNIADKREILHEIYSSYLFKDILEMANIQYPSKLRDLVKLLAFQVGSEVSVNELSNALSINRETVERYIYFLEKSFVIYRLGGYSNNLRKEVSKQNKFYFYDLGVRNSAIENFNYTDQRVDLGNLWENFVINERMKYIQYNRIPASSYFWRTYTGAELDYIEYRDAKLYGYEIKLTKKVAKAPLSFMEAYPDAEYHFVNKDNLLDFI
jgi:uncharacterized protein